MTEFKTIDFDFNEIDIDRDGTNDHVTFRVTQTGDTTRTGDTSVSVQTFIDMSNDGFGQIDSQDAKRFTLTAQPGWRLSEVRYESQKLVLLGEDGTRTSLPINKVMIPRSVAEAGLLGMDTSAIDSEHLPEEVIGGVGGLIGAKGVQFGEGGLGARGSGFGGGGTAGGMGGLGTKGRGSGASGYGTRGGHLGSPHAIGVMGGDVIILGALDKSLIDTVIRRNLSQIRYCYQRELTKDPDLFGKITVKFVVSADGTVSSATIKSSTMRNSAVEEAICERFMRFRFPPVPGGGIAIVSYPFVFSPPA